MTVKPVIYRYTGASPGNPSVISSLSLGTWDSNISLSLYPILRGASIAYSYIAVLALGFESDPTIASSFRFWAALSGGSLDPNVTIKIATTLAETYIRATGTEGNTGASINALYGLSTADLIASYTSANPMYVPAAIKTSGVGRYTHFILIQAEVGASAALGAIPASPVELRLGCSAVES